MPHSIPIPTSHFHKLHPLEEHIYPRPSTQPTPFAVNHAQPAAEGAGILQERIPRVALTVVPGSCRWIPKAQHPPGLTVCALNSGNMTHVAPTQSGHSSLLITPWTWCRGSTCRITSSFFHSHFSTSPVVCRRKQTAWP